jgi:hypothetical protein
LFDDEVDIWIQGSKLGDCVLICDVERNCNNFSIRCLHELIELRGIPSRSVDLLGSLRE